MNRSAAMQEFLAEGFPPPASAAALARLKRGASAVVILVALLVIGGWKFDLALLKSMHPALAAMNANSAFGFLLAGTALACLPAAPRSWRRSSALACSAGVILIGLMTLAQYLAGRDFGIDEFLFRETQAASGNSGSMGAKAALAFMLLGLALMLSAWRERTLNLAQGLALATGAIALVALIGFLYNAGSLTHFASYTGMPLISAGLFFLMVAGCLCIHPEQGVVARLTSPGPGGYSARRLLPLSALLLVGLGGVIATLAQQQVLPRQLELVMLAVGSFVLLAVLIYWNAGWLDRADAERRTAEEARQRSEARYRALVEAASQITWTTDAEGMLVEGPPAWSGFTGQHGGQSRGWGWLEALHPDDRAEAAARWSEAVVNKTPYHAEYRVREASGGYRYSEARAVPICRPDGKVEEWVGMNIDITERKESEAALRRSEERERTRAAELETIMHAVPAALWIAHDPECRQISRNSEADTLIRAAHGDSSATRHYSEFRDGRPLPAEELPIRQAAKGRDVRGAEMSLIFDDGEVRHLFGNAVPLRDRDGSVRGAVAAFIDVTQRKRIEEALHNADRRKDEILAMLAHELRNPLAAISNSIEIMRRVGPLESRLQRPLAIIDSQAQHLARLVEDLLDVARIKQGKLVLRKKTVDLGEAVKRAVETIRPLIDSRQQQLTVSLPPRPIWVEADEMRLAQVFANLLDNAAKYSEPGAHIVISAAMSDDCGIVRVKDRGMGIAPSLLPHVFDLFTQADWSQARAPGGLGVGLALVKSLVEMHGGTVQVMSAGIGQGSEFTVHVPLAPAAAPLAGALPEPAKPSNGSDAPGGWRILVVDDNIDSAQSMALLLRIEGLQTEFAYSGESALARARSFKPQLALIDIGLPGMDGFELARRLRALPETRDALLIALTGYSRPQDRQRALEAGFNHHLVKPVDWDALQALIASLGTSSARDGPA